MIGVTGATGGVGGRVARRLADRGTNQRLLVRDAGRAPAVAGAEVAVFGGFDDPTGFAAALAGVDTLMFVSATEHPERVALHGAAVDAAVDAGVERIVYLSYLGAAPDATFTFGRDHYATEEHIKASGVAFTFLRDSLYLDFVPLLAGAERTIRGPGGDGRLAPVARDDIADVAAVVLTGDGHAGRTYDLTGPAALSLAELAEALTTAAGRPVAYVEETVEAAYASRAGYGAEPFELDGWVSTYTAIAAGELDVVSEDVERLIGRPPIGLEDFLRAHPESLDVLGPP